MMVKREKKEAGSRSGWKRRKKKEGSKEGESMVERDKGDGIGKLGEMEMTR